MEMGEIIKSHRLRLGLSQQELGDKVGVNKAAVQKWESGAVENIKRSKIKMLSTIFGISPTVLLGWGDEWEEANTQMNLHDNSNIHNNGVIGTVSGEVTFNSSEKQLSVHERDLLRIFNKANGKQRLRIMQFIYDIEEEIEKEG